MDKMNIAIISDNHGYFGEDVLKALEGVDEIWHAGDIGTLESLKPLEEIAPIIGVYGNIDTAVTRELYPLNQLFSRLGLTIFMTHIGGYPSKYKKRVKKILEKERPDIYICGHSHICKVMRDHELDLLHINPGAYGHHGFHKFRTIIKCTLTQGKISDLHAVELGMRGAIEKDNK